MNHNLLQKGSITKTTPVQSLHHDVHIANITMYKASLVEWPQALFDLLLKKVASIQMLLRQQIQVIPNQVEQADVLLADIIYHNHV